MSRYKTASDRTDPVGGTTTLQDEYAVLEAMYDAAPAHVPEPQGLDIEDGKAVGYHMEEIDGTTVQDLDYDQLTGEEADELASGLRDGLRSLHEAGIPHGDICTSNIIVDDGLTPYLIDPAGIQPDDPDAGAVMERDQQNMDYITDLIQR